MPPRVAPPVTSTLVNSVCKAINAQDDKRDTERATVWQSQLLDDSLEQVFGGWNMDKELWVRRCIRSKIGHKGG